MNNIETYTSIYDILINSSECQDQESVSLVKGPDVIESSLKYALNSKHLENLKKCLTFTDDGKYILITLKDCATIRVSTYNFSIVITWNLNELIPKSIYLPRFNSGKFFKSSVIDIPHGNEGEFIYEEGLEVKKSFLDKYVYNYLWGIVNNGLPDIYTPKALCVEGLYTDILAKLFYDGMYTPYRWSSAYYLWGDYRLKLSAVSGVPEGKEINAHKPYLIIDKIEENVNGEFVPVKKWQNNSLMINDIVKDIEEIAYSVLTRYSTKAEIEQLGI